MLAITTQNEANYCATDSACQGTPFTLPIGQRISRLSNNEVFDAIQQGDFCVLQAIRNGNVYFVLPILDRFTAKELVDMVDLLPTFACDVVFNVINDLPQPRDPNFRWEILGFAIEAPTQRSSHPRYINHQPKVGFSTGRYRTKVTWPIGPEPI